MVWEMNEDVQPGQLFWLPFAAMKFGPFNIRTNCMTKAEQVALVLSVDNGESVFVLWSNGEITRQSTGFVRDCMAGMAGRKR